MTRQRIEAALLDLGLVVGWVVVVTGAGYALWLLGIASALMPLQLNLVGSAAVVVPLLALFTLTEGGRYQASPGKQWRGLRVRRADDNPLGYGWALLRNLIRVGLPWILIHAAVLALLTARSPVPIDVWVLTASAGLLPGLTVVAMLTGDHRTPHDIASRSQVVPTRGARRFAPPEEAGEGPAAERAPEAVAGDPAGSSRGVVGAGLAPAPGARRLAEAGGSGWGPPEDPEAEVSDGEPATSSGGADHAGHLPQPGARRYLEPAASDGSAAGHSRGAAAGEAPTASGSRRRGRRGSAPGARRIAEP